MRRVIKIGGSLLLRDRLVDEVNDWISRQSPANHLVVVGGGMLIDAIRDLDRVRPGNASETHWLCVDLLHVTSVRVASWFGWKRVETPEQLRQSLGARSNRPTLVFPAAFYSRQLPRPLDVPEDWRTTTDTIAALLAIFIEADELVLLKSCAVDSSLSTEQLANEGIVDHALPLVADRLKAIRVEPLSDPST